MKIIVIITVLVMYCRSRVARKASQFVGLQLELAVV